MDGGGRASRPRTPSFFHFAASQGFEIERVGAWYARRPGAEFGDGVGIPAAWPRR